MARVYNYDDNGNLIQILPPGTAISISYGYNQRNILITVTQTVAGTTATVAEYRYDGDNARYQQIDYSSVYGFSTLTPLKFDSHRVRLYHSRTPYADSSVQNKSQNPVYGGRIDEKCT